MTATTPAEAAQTALEQLIAYIRRSYLPHSPTVALLRAYDAQQAELSQLRAEVASLRQALALHNLEVET
jgi:hypothetical protein